MENINTPSSVAPDEFSVAESEAEKAKAGATDNDSTYTHIFRVPFDYMGNTYDELRFGWNALLGRDGLAIEAELQALGTPAIVPAFSGAYLIRMAARACTEKIGSDAFELMQLSDYNKIRSAARSFLLASE